VQELCDYYNIEDRWVKRLNETISKRKDTKEADLAKLWEVLEHARSPTGLLTVKIGEMECGQFVGKIKADKDVEALSRRFKLDEHVKSRLTELVVRRKEWRELDLTRFAKHLEYSKRPSGLVMILVGKLLEGEMECLPDLEEAEAVMKKHKLDEDARSKLAEIVLKRPEDSGQVLLQLEKHLETSNRPSAMLCMLAGKVIAGENLPDPPPGAKLSTNHTSGPRQPAERERGHADRADRADRDRDRGYDYTRDRDRSRDRERGRDRDRERERDRTRRRSRSCSRSRH